MLQERLSPTTQTAPNTAPDAKSAIGARRQQGAAWLSLGSNICLVALKMSAGLASGSISVLAEGVQSAIDVLASMLILMTLRAAAAPPDPSHPYGHGKFENIASLAQMLLILGSAFYLLDMAWSHWQHPTMPRFDLGVAALAVSLAVNTLVSRHLKKVARETGSQALEAEATHLQGDMLSCAGLLAGLVVANWSHEPRLDPLLAGVMAVVVVASAIRLGRETLRPLLDESLPAEEAALVRQVLEDDARVLDYHQLRTRRAGSQRHIDAHIMLSDQLTFSQAHAVSEDIEHAIRDALPNANVIVHAEPFEEEMRHQQEAHQ